MHVYEWHALLNPLLSNYPRFWSNTFVTTSVPFHTLVVKASPHSLARVDTPPEKYQQKKNGEKTSLDILFIAL
jgi:hypothetical protein